MSKQEFIEKLKKAIENAYDDGSNSGKKWDENYFERCKELGHYQDLIETIPD